MSGFRPEIMVLAAIAHYLWKYHIPIVFVLGFALGYAFG